MRTKKIGIGEFLVKDCDTIKTALQVIDRNGFGTCFVTASDNSIKGVVTDGDIRRALLSGVLLDALIGSILSKSFVSLPFNATNSEIQEQLSDKIRCIPLIDEKGMPVDFASRNQFRQIPVAEPSLNGQELSYVTECIQSGWISSKGKFVQKFESMFSDYCDMPHALSTSNGTTALHLAMAALGIGPGDEVIVPDLTFAATINTVLHCGATPVIVDVDRNSWCIRPSEIRKSITKKTKAIVPVHLYGFVSDMDEITKIANEYKLLVIEDCAESLGSEWKGKKAGSFGDAACFSFFGNKTITTGEGGMITFRNKAIYENACQLRDHGMSKSVRYWHDQIGYNYRLTNLQAAVGVAQMERVDEFIDKKIKNAELYSKHLSGVPGLHLPPNSQHVKNTYWLYSILIDPKFRVNRDQLIEEMLRQGVETRPLFYPLHHMEIYKKFKSTERSLKNSAEISSLGISLPSSVTLTKEEIHLTCEVINKIYQRGEFMK